ncbi:MAG: hypothetical protein IGS54_08895 [Elainella sp. C42_A2020_010]|nr:hypothetical protein [Elainella sp. C42_A2020_010]
METLDTALTYLIDIVMALGGGYIGTSLVLYLADRWNELEPKPKLQESQKVNIPLTLKATNAVPLELEQELAVAMPVEPLVAPAPERQEIRTVVPDQTDFEVLEAPTLAKPSLAEEPDLEMASQPATPETPSSDEATIAELEAELEPETDTYASETTESETAESELHNHEDEAGIEAIPAELAPEEDLDRDIVQETSD